MECGGVLSRKGFTVRVEAFGTVVRAFDDDPCADEGFLRSLFQGDADPVVFSLEFIAEEVNAVERFDRIELYQQKIGAPIAIEIFADNGPAITPMGNAEQVGNVDEALALKVEIEVIFFERVPAHLVSADERFGAELSVEIV